MQGLEAMRAPFGREDSILPTHFLQPQPPSSLPQTRLTLMEMTAGTFPKLSSTQLPFSLMRATTAEAMNSTRLPLLTRITVLTLKCPMEGQSNFGNPRAGYRHGGQAEA